MDLSQLIKDKKFKSFLSKLYSIGASVVVLGALFKIQHWPGASLMLTTGLLTEALIFFVYAFEDDEEAAHDIPEVIQRTMFGKAPYKTAEGELDRLSEPGNESLLSEQHRELYNGAQLSPDLFHNINNNLRKLSAVTEDLSSMGDVSDASLHYIKTLKSADQSLGKLAKSYESTINKVVLKSAFKYQSIEKSLTAIETETRQYEEQMKTLNQHLGMLNKFYQSQKEGMDNYLQEIGMSAKETKMHREQLAKTNQNLAALNEVYNGMLGAMKKT